ncbi:MAG: phosphatase PAP2 family protein [Hoylesella buccalis]
MTWIPLYIALVYLVIKNNETMMQIFLVIGFATLCLLLSSGMTDAFIKPLVGRIRPCNDLMLKYQIDVVAQYRPRTFSFFSGHASNTFSIALFLCLLVRSSLFSFFMITWSLLNAYTRLYLGVHFPSDVLVGFAWATVVGFSTYWMYCRVNRKLSANTNYISSQYTQTGYNYKDVHLVILVMSLSFMYAIFRGLVLFT